MHLDLPGLHSFARVRVVGFGAASGDSRLDLPVVEVEVLVDIESCTLGLPAPKRGTTEKRQRRVTGFGCRDASAGLNRAVVPGERGTAAEAVAVGAELDADHVALSVEVLDRFVEHKTSHDPAKVTADPKPATPPLNDAVPIAREHNLLGLGGGSEGLLVARAGAAAVVRKRASATHAILVQVSAVVVNTAGAVASPAIITAATRSAVAATCGRNAEHRRK